MKKLTNQNYLTIQILKKKLLLIFCLAFIFKKKKIFILALIISTIFSLIRTTREKIYNPIFKGEFSILVSDPIKQISGQIHLAGQSGGMLKQLEFS